MEYIEFRKSHPAVRCFQRYTSEERANISASIRSGHRQREAVGEYFYTHSMRPGIAFKTAKEATSSAFFEYALQERQIRQTRERGETS